MSQIQQIIYSQSQLTGVPHFLTITREPIKNDCHT